MPCQYQERGFCSYLEPELLPRLCALCRLKKYSRGLCLRQNYWAGTVPMVTEGLAVQLDNIEAEHPIPIRFAVTGTVMDLREMFPDDLPQTETVKMDTLCLTTCTVAVFPADELVRLTKECPAFQNALFRYVIMHQMTASEALIRHITFGDAEESICCMLRFLKQNGIDYLTHEQVALLTGRSRQTVTTVMKRLQVVNPELFAPQS